MTIIRKANLLDLDQIIVLDEECFGDDKYSKNFWKHLLNISEVFVAVDKKNKIIGSISIIFVPEHSKGTTNATKFFLKQFNIKDYYLITTICVSCLYRSSGVGSKLLKKVIKQKNHVVLLNVRESNIKAINFYEKHGFYKAESIDKNYYNNPKENALLMYHNNF